MEKLGRYGGAGKQGVMFVVMFLWLSSFWNSCWAQGAERVLDLEEAYSLALKNQEKIHIAKVEVEKSRLLPKKAMTILMPRMSMTGTYTRLDDPIEFEAELGTFTLGNLTFKDLTLPPIQTFPEEQTVGNFEYVQPIYEAEFFPARRQAAQAVELTMEGYSQTAQEVLFKVAQAYYEVLKGERLLQNANETLDLTQEELRVSRVKFGAGAVTEDTVLTAELNLTRAHSKVIKSLNSLTIARDALRNLLGLEDQPLRLVEPPKLEEETASYDQQVQKALDTRHDYKRTALKVKLAEGDVDLVKAKFHPRLEASWDYYKVSDPSWAQTSDYWAAHVRLKVPLFEGGQRYFDLKEKRYSVHQAKLALDDLKGTIKLDVKDAMLRMQTEKSLLDNAKKQMALADKNYTIVFSKYQYGAATFTDLNEAHLYLELAQTDLITSIFDYQISLLNMQRAVGMFAKAYMPQSGKR